MLLTLKSPLERTANRLLSRKKGVLASLSSVFIVIALLRFIPDLIDVEQELFELPKKVE